MVGLLHENMNGVKCEWVGNANELKWELVMEMRFQCLLDKNKWEWECTGMPLMCLLSKINGNMNQFTKIHMY